MWPLPIEAVVFDMDGLLVDTEILCQRVMVDLAGELGRDLPLPVFLSMVGSSAGQSAGILRDHFGDEAMVQHFLTGFRERFHAIEAADIALKAGVVELLDELDARDLPYAIATSSPHAEIERNLRSHGLQPRFRAAIARGDYANGKPHPEPYLMAAAALGVPPERCLALEDSHNGVRSAHAAGMMTVMVPDLLEPTEEIRGLCVAVAESLHEVRALLDAAPPERQA